MAILLVSPPHAWTAASRESVGTCGGDGKAKEVCSEEGGGSGWEPPGQLY